jgi:hypothetical protein
VIVERDLQSEKQNSQIFSTEQGIQIVESDEQSQNAEPSRDKSLELDLNVIVERDLQPEKQFVQNFSTEEGIQIVESDEQAKNAERSIHESLELDSNVIVERDVHPEKQRSQIFSTEQGIQIDRKTSAPLDTFSYTLISSTETTKPETERNRRGNSQTQKPRESQQARSPSYR